MSKKTVAAEALVQFRAIVDAVKANGGDPAVVVLPALAQLAVAQSIDRLTELLRPTIAEINALIERAKAEEARGTER